MKLENLGQRYPELFRPPFFNGLPGGTLKELGIKGPVEAVTSGLVCIRPQTVEGHRTLPAIWVSEPEFPAIAALIDEIDALRKTAPKHAGDAKRAREQQANLSEALREFTTLTNLGQQAVRKVLDAEFLAELSAQPKNAVKRFVTKNAPPWRDLALDPHRGTYLADGYIVSACTKGAVLALLEKNPDQYLDTLNAKLAQAKNDALEKYQHWNPSRPEWFSEDQLRVWSVHAVNGRFSEHPLQTLSEIRQLCDKTTKVEVFPGRYAETRTAPLAAASKLWAVTLLTKASPSAQLHVLLKHQVEAEVETARNQFLAANPFTVECARNEYSQEEWQTFLHQAFVHALPVKFFVDKAVLDAQAQASTWLAKRHLELAAKRCRSELPASLKDFYPLARAMRRELTFIYGPTNSGKTHHALEALKNAKTGSYLGPLRLLALEVFDRLNDAGTPTSLVTGEVVQKTPGARHTAATIEMLNLGEAVEVAVIDEVQMLADPDRGSAWLQAVLGAPANHVVMLGSASALTAVRMLAKVTGERLNEVQLKRLTPLEVSDHPIVLKNAPKGSALIVFSRQAALSMAQHMRSKYDRKVSVVYGALSPEVRSEQARQFREGETDILVSTDAIGMGLNLPIHTVIFTTTTKWNGVEEVSLDHSLTCQIAGRAGRFGLQDAGVATATEKNDLKFVRRMLEKPLASLAPPYWAGLSLEMADSISRHLDTQSLSQIIAFFQESMKMEEWAHPSCSQDQLFLAGYLDQFELTLPIKLLLSNAPAVDKGTLNFSFKAMVDCVVQDSPEDLPLLKDDSRKLSLEAMESKVKSLTLYSWMHYRFTALFPRIDEAQELLSHLNTAISQALTSAPSRRCAECNKPVPWDHAFGKCDSCFSSGKRYARNYSGAPAHAGR